MRAITENQENNFIGFLRLECWDGVRRAGCFGSKPCIDGLRRVAERGKNKKAFLAQECFFDG